MVPCRWQILKGLLERLQRQRPLLRLQVKISHLHFDIAIVRVLVSVSVARDGDKIMVLYVVIQDGRRFFGELFALLGQLDPLVGARVRVD